MTPTSPLLSSRSRPGVRSRLCALGRRVADDRGDVVIIETLLWVPIVVLLLGLTATALRRHTTTAISQDAAEAAARAAARAPDPDTGRRLADQSLQATLATYPGTCDTTIDTATWNAGQVTVTVTCTTDLDGLDRFTPGPHQVTRSWTETVDNARIARTGPDR